MNRVLLPVALCFIFGVLSCTTGSRKTTNDRTNLLGENENSNGASNARTPSSNEYVETELNQEIPHGSQEQENAEFQDFSDRIKKDMKAQVEFNQKTADGRRTDGTRSALERGFHAKNQTCLQGEFFIYDDQKNPVGRTRHGIF